MSHGIDTSTSFEDLAQIAISGAFEEAVRGLEVVVDHLERGLLPIDESIAWYELGLRLSRRSETLLRDAELRVSELHDAFGISPDGDSIWQNSPDD